MEIIQASGAYIQQAKDLLAANQLPFHDISAQTSVFVLAENGLVTGTIASEQDHQTALLRSLSVSASNRQSGLGSSLVDFLEKRLRSEGIREVYLLTTTAAPFFARRGYQVINRAEVPDFIRHTSEYCGVCPSSATVMKKTLA